MNANFRLTSEAPAPPAPAPWLPRNERTFRHLATAVRADLDPHTQRALDLCGQDAWAPARARILSSPSAVFALEDTAAWLREMLTPAARSRPPIEWRHVASMEEGAARMRTLVALIATLAEGQGAVPLAGRPCSLPGLDVCVDGGADDAAAVEVRRNGDSDGDGWTCRSGHRLRPIANVPLYDAHVRIDGHALWISHVRAGLRCRSTIDWSWGDTPREAAALVELSLGDDGVALASLVNTIVPLEPRETETFSSFSSSVAPGALFLTVTPRPEMLAEMIVHEAGHTWLNVQGDRGAVLRPEARGIVLPSPFRGTDRPIMGVVHGVVAFGWIRRYWRGLAERRVRPYLEVARTRIDRVDAQIIDGIRALKTTGGAVTGLGWELIEMAVQHARG